MLMLLRLRQNSSSLPLLSLLGPRLLPMTRLPLLAARWMPMRVWV